jgi:ubiquinone/menaquinone biosynthesis C-methylase UbiE
MSSEWNVDASRIAENYERFLVPRIFRPGAEQLLDILSPGPGDSLLDVACGTGIVARLAADRVGSDGRVVGVDMLPDMLAVAQAADSRVKWQQATADNMPLPDDSFDVVTCQQGLQFFPDKAAALREMRRVSAPGGRLGVAVLADISRTPALNALADSFEQHLGPAPAQFVRLVGSMSDADELRTLVEGAGFEGVALQTISTDINFPSAEDFVRQYLMATPLAANPSVSEADESALREVERDVASALNGSSTSGSFAAESIVVTARAA